MSGCDYSLLSRLARGSYSNRKVTTGAAILGSDPATWGPIYINGKHPAEPAPTPTYTTDDSNNSYQDIIKLYMNEYKKLVDAASKIIDNIIKQSSQIDLTKLNEIMEQLLNLEIKIKKDLIKNIDNYFIVEPRLKNDLKKFLIQQRIELAALLNKIGNGFWTPLEIEIVSTNVTNSVDALNETIMSALTNPIVRLFKKELENISTYHNKRYNI